jgi:hypothetical protein
MLREAVGQGADGAGAPAPDGGSAGGNGRESSLMERLTGLIRRNWIFSLGFVLALVPRAVAMLGYRPAVLFKLDTYDYLWNATHLQPDAVNTSGYSLFLRALWPFHSLMLVAALQHIMGLALAVIMYALLRRYNVIPWVAALATVPVLFSASEVFAEHLIMADFLALALMIASFAVLLWQGKPSAWRAAAAGLLMAMSVLIRPTTLPLIVLMAVYLLIRRAGWRAVSAVIVAGAVPIVAYMAWFASTPSGSFNLTDSNGLFLWSRTMTFANCAVIKPPKKLIALCPGNQPGYLNQPIGKRPPPKDYLWDHQAWMWRGKPVTIDGVVPDKAAFTPADNALGQQFAIKAIEAQPLAYLHAVGRELVQPFIHRDTFVFELVPTHTASLGPVNGAYALAAVRDYQGNLKGIGPFLGRRLGARLVRPWNRLIRGYQRLANLPSWVYALIVLAGLAGIVWPRRRSWAAALLWVSGVIAMVVPVAEHDYTYRYVLPVVPLVCMAAALCFGRLPRTQPAADAPAELAAPAVPRPQDSPAPANGTGQATGAADDAGTERSARLGTPRS